MIRKTDPSVTESDISKEKVVEDAKKWVRHNSGLILQRSEYDSPRISSELADCSMPLTFDQYNYCSLGCLYCAVPGTRIPTVDGTVPIEKIEVGDQVYSFDTENQRVDVDIVDSVMQRNVDVLIEIELENGIVLKVTENHPLYVKNKGWIEAKDLLETDELLYNKNPHLSYYNVIHNKGDSRRKAASKRMKENNPMRNSVVAKKVGATRKKKFLSGEYIPYWKGKKKPDAVLRMKGPGNPMKNVEKRKGILQKIVKSWVANGKISKGEENVRKALSTLGLNFIHQATFQGPRRVYVLDFFLPDHNLCIEYDGHSKHYTKRGKLFDRNRDSFLQNEYGVRTVRVHRDLAFSAELNDYLNGVIS